MSNEKVQEAFQAWAETNIPDDGMFDDSHIEIAGRAWQAATSAAQRDAMAVAEAVRDACETECNKMQAANMKISKDFKDRSFARLADGGLECKESIAKIDLAALVESVQPASAQQQVEPVGHATGKFLGDVNGNVFCEVKTTGKTIPMGAALYTTPPAPACSAPDGWRDIESAPKDGRTILLGYFNALGNWRTLRGQWFTKEHIDDEWEDADTFDAGWYETSVEAEDVPSCWPTNPTHWMPAPAAPKGGVIHCLWKPHDDLNMPGTWEGSCGALWSFTEGGPKENGVKFCHECGKPVRLEGAA